MEVWDRRKREEREGSETEREIERNAGKLETVKWRGAK